MSVHSLLGEGSQPLVLMETEAPLGGVLVSPPSHCCEQPLQGHLGVSSEDAPEAPKPVVVPLWELGLRGRAP